MTVLSLHFTKPVSLRITHANPCTDVTVASVSFFQKVQSVSSELRSSDPGRPQGEPQEEASASPEEEETNTQRRRKYRLEQRRLTTSAVVQLDQTAGLFIY